MRARYGLGLSALLLLVLIVTAPARLLSLLLPAETLLLQGVSGSVWRGQSARCLVAVGHGYVHLGTVSWQLQPLSLLTLSPSLRLQSTWGKQTLSGQVKLRTADNVDLSDVEGRMPAALLRQLMPVMVDGEFSVQLPELRIRDGLPESGHGRVVWQGATWLAPAGARSLGDYALDFQQLPGQDLVGEVLTLSGPIEASGSISLQERRYEVDLYLQSDRGLDSDLQQALSFLGQPEEGGYRIDLGGDF